MKSKEKLNKFFAILFWLIVWYLAAVIINKRVILVTPVEAITTLCQKALSTEFYHTVEYSAIRIIGGFLISATLGSLFAVLSYNYKIIHTLIAPLISVIKSTPVASLVILALFWMPSSFLSIFISFLMVFPIIYTNVYEGLSSVNIKMIEMADLFEIKGFKRGMYIYLPQVMPHFISACKVSLGMCWKSGVAAEVIGQPTGSLGDALYKSKIYLETADLFAWTIAIILVSFAFEKLFLFILKSIDNIINK